jgi:hypothetical protein
MSLSLAVSMSEARIAQWSVPPLGPASSCRRAAGDRRVADHHMGDRGLGGDAALDQPSWGRRLHHHILAGAGILRPAEHQHAELGGHDIWPICAVLADRVQSPCGSCGELGDPGHLLQTLRRSPKLFADETSAISVDQLDAVGFWARKP